MPIAACFLTPAECCSPTGGIIMPTSSPRNVRPEPVLSITNRRITPLSKLGRDRGVTEAVKSIRFVEPRLFCSVQRVQRVG